MPGAVDAFWREEMRDRITALAHEEVVHQVDGGPRHEEVQQQHQEGVQQRDAVTFDRQHAGQHNDADHTDRQHTGAGCWGDFPDRVDAGQQRQHGAVGVERDDRQEARHRDDHQQIAQPRHHRGADLVQRHQRIRCFELLGQPGAEADHPAAGQRGADEHRRDQFRPAGVFRQVTGIVRHVGCIGNVVAGTDGEQRGEGHPVEAQVGRRRDAFLARAEHQGDGHQCVQRQGRQQGPLEGLVHQVVAVDRQQRADQHHDHGDDGRVNAEHMFKAVHDQRDVHHVETNEHKHRRHQRQDHPAITELGAGLDHLRQAHFRAL
ncbi:hypothetical protein D3C87_1179810 [compost metagenome]